MIYEFKLAAAAALCLLVVALSPAVLLAQDSNDEVVAKTPAQDSAATGKVSQEEVQKKVGQKIDDVAERVNQYPAAQEASKNILKSIYDVAEYLSFSSFHWIAFALMVAGLVSFALQLVLGKLFALLQFHFSPIEIMSDGLGFLISAIGLVLTTQAATENSNFTESPALVLSAVVVGVLLGLVFYVRGQTQEFREAREVRRRRKTK
jgi:hypothetical protein